MAIAQELANEKAARNPQRYDGTVADVDITRAMNMIFHSDWKKQMKKKALGQMVNKSMERAGKQDKVINQKNIRAIGRMLGDKDFQMDIDKSSARFSDSKGGGRGSNQ
jgi:predicted HNH restriction endonuclease